MNINKFAFRPTTNGVYTKNDIKVLVLYGDNSTFTPTVHEHLLAFRNYLPFEVHYANAVLNYNDIQFFDDYDVFIVHYSCGLYHPDYISESVLERLTQTEAVKIVFAQDEYDNTNELVRKINLIKPDYYYTCVPYNLHKKVFKGLDSGISLVNNLTGYVTREHQLFAEHLDAFSRDIEISYKGRPLHPKYGQLGFQKWHYGRLLKEYCLKNVVIHDISVTEEERLYWADWEKLLLSSKAMLITPSGSDVFDFDGSIRSDLDNEYGEDLMDNYEKIVNDLASYEKKFSTMAQISPKVFETMAYGCVPVVVGDYLPDEFVPFENYMPIAMTDAALELLFQRLSDEKLVQTIVENNRNLLLSGKFSYADFMREIEGKIRQTVKYTLGRQFMMNVSASYQTTDWVVFPQGQEEKYQTQITSSLQSFRFWQTPQDIRSSPSSNLNYHLDIWTQGMARETWKPAKITLRQALIGKQREAMARLGSIVKNLQLYSAAHESGADLGLNNRLFKTIIFLYKKLPAPIRKMTSRYALIIRNSFGQ